MESDSSVFIYIFNGLLGKEVPWVYTARGFLFLSRVQVQVRPL
jgi:hypothetical protein